MNTDDPKFTAHALGELADLTPAERAEIEALLASDPTAAAEAAETQALAARLRAELPGEAAAALQEGQRAAVLKAVGSTDVTAKVVRFPRRANVLAAVAACAVVGITATLIVQSLQTRNHTPPRSTVVAEKMPDISLLVADGSVTDPDSKPSLPILATPAPASPAVPVGEISLAQKEYAVGSGVPAAPVAMPFEPQTATLKTSTETGPSTLTLAGTNSYTGTPTVTAGGRLSVSSSLDAAAERQLREAEAFSDTGRFVLAEKRYKQVLQKDPNNIDAAEGLKKTKDAMLQYGVAAHNETRADVISKTEMHWARPIDQFHQRESEARTNRQGGAFEYAAPGSSSFDAIAENVFLPVRETPLSTFSIDVDTASYAIVRRMLNDNQRPPDGAVRIEELLNYFSYDYPQPKGDVPFSATMEVAACPWAPEHRLVRIGLKGREIPKDQRPPSNLVFLIDVSGSMNMPIKLPLLKQSLGLLIEQLREQDQVAIVVYAGNSGCVLESTHDKSAMREAIGRLEAGGSTNGASGIQLAYQIAEKNFIKGGTNRVILATDGDWNVGITNQNSLLDMIARKAKSGVFLTALGFGMDNLNDSMLVKLADRGNGNYAYIDTLIEAKKVFVEQLSSTLVTIAKDVKIQVEFNPAQVGAYRLAGYEKRLLAKEDFNNDQKDAGEIGAGHTVTALYEVVPAGQVPPVAMVDQLKYQPQPGAGLPKDAAPESAPEPAPAKREAPVPATAAPAAGDVANGGVLLPAGVRKEMLTLKLRYKAPDGDQSKLLEFPLTDPGTGWEKSSPDFRFAAAVAGYGMLLRHSDYSGQVTWSSVAEWAHEGLGSDASGYRTEFLSLLEKAKALAQ